MVNSWNKSPSEADALLSVFADFDGLLSSLSEIELLKGKIRQALTTESARKEAIIDGLTTLINKRHLADAEDHAARLATRLLPHKSPEVNSSILRSIVTLLSRTEVDTGRKVSANVIHKPAVR